MYEQGTFCLLHGNEREIYEDETWLKDNCRKIIAMIALKLTITVQNDLPTVVFEPRFILKNFSLIPMPLIFYSNPCYALPEVT